MRATSKKSLLEVLLGRLGKKQPPLPAKRELRPFQAVSIYRGMRACDLAKRFSEHRFLARDAPPLPLGGCTMRATCQCKYIKHKDRRGGARRLIEFGMSPRLFDGRERRNMGGRRNGEG